MFRRWKKLSIGLTAGMVISMNVTSLHGQDSAAIGHATVQKAISLQRQGRWADAESLLTRSLDSCRDRNSGQQCRLVLRFALAYLEDQLALEDTARSQTHWGEAARLYQLVLEESPDNPEAINNLALVRIRLGQWEEAVALLTRVASLLPSKRSSYTYLIGDLYQRNGKLKEALEAFKACIESDTTNESAGYAIIRIYRDLPNSALSELFDFSKKLRSWGQVGAATDGFGLIILHCSIASKDLAEQALFSWAEACASQGPISINALRDFHGSTLDNSPPTPSPIRELEAIITAKGELNIYLRWWLSTPVRSNLAAKIIKLRADELRVTGNIAGAIRMLEQALYAAPLEPEFLVPKELRDAPLSSVEVAQELATLYHKYGMESEFRRLEDRLFREKMSAYLGKDLKAIQRLHTLLGLIYAERGQWNAPNPTNGIFQLEHAISTAVQRINRDEISGESLPYLRETLAKGYTKVNRPDAAFRMNLQAAAGYLDIDNLRRAGELIQVSQTLPYPPSAKEKSIVQTMNAILGARNRIHALESGWNKQTASKVAEQLQSLLPTSLDGSIDGLDQRLMQRQYFKMLTDLSISAYNANEMDVMSTYQKKALSVVGEDSKLYGARDRERIEKSLQMNAVAQDPAVLQKAMLQLKEIKKRSQ